MRFRTNKTEQGTPAVKRPLALFCLAFSAAVFGAVYLLAGWQTLLLGGLLIYLGLVCLLKRNVLWMLVLLGLAAGLWLSWCQTASRQLLEWSQVGRTLPLELQVRDFPRSTSYGVSVETEILTEGALHGVSVLLWLPQGQGLRPGDQLTAEVTLSSAEDSDPDWRYYNLSQGIRLSGRADWAEVRSGEIPWDLRSKIWARQLGQGLERCFSGETAGFLFALTTGNRELLSESLEEQLSATGLSHVVAASGLHVHLLFSVLCLLPVGRRWRGLVLLPFLLLFAAIAGFTPSICRAALMEGIFLLGPLFDREADGLTSLSLALALLLGQNIYAAASVSLQLSFAAMFGLRVVCPALGRRLREGACSGWKYRILSSLTTTLGANVFTLPLVLRYFGTVSLLSPLSNLVVLWLLPALLPMALLGGLLGWLCPVLGQLLALPVGWLANLVLGLIDALAGIPWSTLPQGVPFLAWVVLCYAVGVILYFCHGTARQVLSSVVLLLALLPVAGWAVQTKDSPADFTAVVLDVGQGQCLLLQSEQETAVIDCGGTGKQAREALEQALHQTGADSIDRLILTHYDQDHTGGVPQLLLDGRVKCLCLPEPVEDDQARAQALRQLAEGMGVTVCTITEETYATVGSTQLTLCPVEDGEEQGLAVLASRGTFDLLVTGDISQAGEAALMQSVNLPQLEVLIAGHHGSDNATSASLLEETQPQVVIFSVGENGYGHPTQGALDRCQAAGAQLRRTDQNGDIWIQVWETD